MRQLLGELILIGAVCGGALGGPRVGGDVTDDVFYQFMPIAWRDSDNDAYRFGDFGGMADSLQYLDDLGVTAIWMNPIFPSPAYHGYQHGRADEVNPWFGSEADFLDFVAAAHARGIKVFVDFVVYGVSHDSPWFQSAYGNPASPYDDWLAFENSANTSYLGSSYTTWNGDHVGFIHWNLNNSNPTALVTGWAQHWLDPDGNGNPSDGIDGYRLDHVWYQYPNGPNGWGYNIDWWADWNAALETINPDVFIFAEQADWGSTGADLLEAFDAAFTKPFEFAARDALANGNASGLYSSMAGTLAALPEGKTFMAILGDHDVDRLASVIGDSFGRGRAAAAVLMTQPFPPIIYYGDEIGMRGTKQPYGSDNSDIPMREPFKWNAAAGPPMSNYWVLDSQAYNNAFAQDHDGRSVEEQAGVGGSLLETYRALIAARHDNVALRQGSYHAVSASSNAIWSFVRYAEGQQTLLVAINVGGSFEAATLDLSDVEITGGSTSVVDVISGQSLTTLTTANQDAYPLNLGAYAYRILEIDAVPQPPTPNVIDGLNIPDNLGPAAWIATQDNATGMGDDLNELDELYVRVDPDNTDALAVGLTGNLGEGPGMALFFDAGDGGQNVLDTDSFNQLPYHLSNIDGMVLDAGFTPERVLFVNVHQGTVYVDLYTLNAGGGGSKRYLGSTTLNAANGFLVGGTNTNGLQLALNNSNTAGVTDVDASAAGTATSGFEILMPLADIGLASAEGRVELMAMLLYNDGQVGNQFLPGLGGGYDNLGEVPLDLNVIPGAQYASVVLDRIPGDWDGDGDVDLLDFQIFELCYTGPDAGPLGPGCATLDLDADLDIDLADAAAFQRGFLP